MIYLTEELAEEQKKTMACPGHRETVVYLTSESQALTVILLVVNQLVSQKRGSEILLGDFQGSFGIVGIRL